MTADSFHDFFTEATGYSPYPYQVRLASAKENPGGIINIPTGMGKTAAIVISWIWRRRFHEDKAVRTATPRRLVYCLPMRVLVEQTSMNTVQWLQNLALLGGDVTDRADAFGTFGHYTPSFDNPEKIVVTTLMGGAEPDEWDLYPERDAIIIGTQDMLLSRALNRGYGMSRYRWPVHFGLLNNDCLWVMDEVQLMGVGLTTGVQMEAFRSRIGTVGTMPAKTLWMSATLKQEWLRTVDFNPEREISPPFILTDDDRANQSVRVRIQAKKLLNRVPSQTDVKTQPDIIIEKHHPGTRTLVVVNTVKRAKEVYQQLKKNLRKNSSAPGIVLIHSQFRPQDRQERVQKLLAEPGAAGTIIVSTQVIEAGVDVSAKTLFTELAPWSSLVQRFGRCNRSGEFADASIFWINLLTGEKSQALPYTDEELDESRKILESLEGKDASPESLPPPAMSVAVRHVIRKKDIIDLFDTTPDLTGHDTDISRFIRETDDRDVQVFWREPPNGKSAEDVPRPCRDELCPAPIGEVRELVKNTKSPMKGWYWDPLEERWSAIQSSMIYPGLTIMLDAGAGHYLPDEGWDAKSKKAVPVISHEQSPADDWYDSHTSSEGSWETISVHTDKVWKEMDRIISSLSLPDAHKTQLLEAVRWHDAGKAHPAFQAMIKPEELTNFPGKIAAKAPQSAWKHGRIARPEDGRRRYFRHELASGILALSNGKPDLVSYLAAAHHGKVRLSIRSMPDEFYPPETNTRFARGVWDGDRIPELDLGGGVTLPATTINLSYMDLGEGSRGPSWLARTLALRDREDLGIFRLAYMEALVKAADERASRGKP